MAFFYRYDYTEITKNIHPCLAGGKRSQLHLIGTMQGHVYVNHVDIHKDRKDY